MSKIRQVPIGDIVVRKKNYPRLDVDRPLVWKYRNDGLETVLGNAPIEVNQDNILIDGRHRLEAAKQSDWAEVPVVVTETASDREVLLLAIKRNREHGKQLSSVDKRRCVLSLYGDMVTPETVTEGHTAAVAELAGIVASAKKTVRNWLYTIFGEMKGKRDGLVLSARAKGDPVAKIVAKFNISESTYNRIVQDHKEKEDADRAERDRRILADAKAGMTQEAIAKKHGVDQSRVSQIMSDRHSGRSAGVTVAHNNADEVANTDFKVRDSPEDHAADSEDAMQQESPKPPIDITPGVAKAPETEAAMQQLEMEHAESPQPPGGIEITRSSSPRQQEREQEQSEAGRKMEHKVHRVEDPGQEALVAPQVEAPLQEQERSSTPVSSPDPPMVDHDSIAREQHCGGRDRGNLDDLRRWMLSDERVYEVWMDSGRSIIDFTMCCVTDYVSRQPPKGIDIDD